VLPAQDQQIGAPRFGETADLGGGVAEGHRYFKMWAATGGEELGREPAPEALQLGRAVLPLRGAGAGADRPHQGQGLDGHDPHDREAGGGARRQIQAGAHCLPASLGGIGGDDDMAELHGPSSSAAPV